MANRTKNVSTLIQNRMKELEKTQVYVRVLPGGEWLGEYAPIECFVLEKSDGNKLYVITDNNDNVDEDSEYEFWDSGTILIAYEIPHPEYPDEKILHAVSEWKPPIIPLTYTN